MKDLLSIFMLLFTTSAWCQEDIPVTIPLPANPHGPDFTFLKTELQGKRIVMLGEMSHDDGNVFEMKTRLVQYLVDELGFTTIAFESGVFDVWQAQQQIEKNGSVKDAFVSSLFPVWANSEQFQSFIQYFDEHKSKLKLFGFDSQITGREGVDRLVNQLYAYVKANGLQLKLKADDLALLLESISKSGMYDDADISYKDFKGALTELLTQLKKQKPSDDSFYWTQVLKSMMSLGEDSLDRQEIYSPFNTTAEDNIRDRQMADNLLKYIRRFPDEKIICWGANQHFVNNMASVNTPILKDFKPMGTYLKAELKNNIYSLAAVTAADSVYLQNRWHKTPIDTQSFESLLKKQNVPHLFISSKQPGMTKLQRNRFFSPVSFVDARLDELHDGYLFFLHTTPSTFIDSSVKDADPGVGADQVAQILDMGIGQGELLHEVVLYSKKTPYQILKNALDKRQLNYPDFGFGSTLYTNIEAVIDGTSILNVDLLADQYDQGYISYTNRSTKKLKQVRWNLRSAYEPKSLQEFHGLMYNSPIQYAPILHLRKFKKFDLQLEEVKTINGDEVYVIGFQSSRKHSTFTRRVYLSHYSGKLYINKKDFAVLKLYEQWEVTDFPESFRQGYELSGESSKYTRKEYTVETNISEFIRHNEMYYLSHAVNTVAGKLSGPGEHGVPYHIVTEAYWNNFDSVAPKIPYKSEQLLLHESEAGPAFWHNFRIPD